MPRYVLPAVAELTPFEVRGDGASQSLQLDAIRSMVLHAELSVDHPVRPEGSSFWAPAAAWALLDLDAAPPPRHLPEHGAMPAGLRQAAETLRRQLRWWLRDGERVRGPLNWDALGEALEKASMQAQVGLVGGSGWYPRSELSVAGSEEALVESLYTDENKRRCTVCLESIDASLRVCPECHEIVLDARDPLSSRPNSQREGAVAASWLRMHWRPSICMAVVGLLLGSGVALRQAAPNRYEPPLSVAPNVPAAAPACDTLCWEGETCQLGRCVWRAPNDVGQLASSPTVAGPFDAPAGMVDALPLDEDRYAVSSMRGVHIINSRTGIPITLVSDAPQAKHLLSVGEVFYATAPRRIYVVDKDRTRVLKTIEIGAEVASMQMAPSGQRVLAAVPGAHAVAVIATQYHAEVSRFFFGDDKVRQVAVDHSGQHAITTNGVVPLPGAKAPRAASRYGALYAFDPSGMASQQDRVRTGMMGNPADGVLTPDGSRSYVLLRERDTVVRLDHMPSGTVRQVERLNTCHQPEQIEMIRRGRRALVRCDGGNAIDVLDLEGDRPIKRLELNRTISDVVVTPNGKQAVLVLPRAGAGAVGLLDLDSYILTLVELSGQPQRVRLAPDGRSAIVTSDRSKAIWVLR